MVLPGARDRRHARVLHKCGRVAQAAIFADGKNGDAAAVVVRHQRILSGVVNGDVAGSGAAGRDLIQEGELAGGLAVLGAINRKCAEASAIRALIVGNFIDGIEESAVGMDREP